MSNSLRPCGLQCARFLCPSLSPWVCSNSCPWVSNAIHPSHPLLSPSPLVFNLPASGSFPMSRLFASGGQCIGASASVLLMDIQGWFPLGLTGLISLQSKGLSKTSISALVAWMVKNPLAVLETWVWSLGREDPLEKGMAIHFSILAWTILWTEEPGGIQSMVSQGVGHDWETNTFPFFFLILG